MTATQQPSAIGLGALEGRFPLPAGLSEDELQGICEVTGGNVCEGLEGFPAVAMVNGRVSVSAPAPLSPADALALARRIETVARQLAEWVRP